ncbi:hypothetical protein AVEN_226711-1 [Araneus ventricosus]|uniref:Uncharacterized protein n=1 Tax=Araneus ventricosus TaxID=182803 RepID=A0A4Y2CXP4_ARAVE|nr:hypothetical protein AVEN_226711-1 [Araneus ventricosus]
MLVLWKESGIYRDSYWMEANDFGPWRQIWRRNEDSRKYKNFRSISIRKKVMEILLEYSIRRQTLSENYKYRRSPNEAMISLESCSHCELVSCSVPDFPQDQPRP